jgi:hypothetical protein
LLLLTPIASAFPPDPTWLSGFWDNGDCDEVIITIVSSVGTVDVSVLGEARPVPHLVALLRLRNEQSRSVTTVALDLTRAPPST